MTFLSPSTLLEALVQALLEAMGFNSGDSTAPDCVLWTDEAQQWTPLIPLLRPHLPLLTLGSYTPLERIGPAVWLRCAMVPGVLPESEGGLTALEAGRVPVLYLPGVSRANIRSIEECPPHLGPLAALQYSSSSFFHKNGKDWTVSSFLASKGVTVGPDAASKEGLLRGLVKLAEQPLAELSAASPLKADFFARLFTPDPDREVLDWLSDPLSARKRLERETGAWESFCALCTADLGFRPLEDGPLTAALLLGQGKGRWGQVWERFADAPQRFPGLPKLMLNARPGLSFEPDPQVWPQDNEAQEGELRSALRALEGLGELEAKERIVALESVHGLRRESVWAKLQEAPLARALEALCRLAHPVLPSLGVGDPTTLAQRYAAGGWHTDQAALKALEGVSSTGDREAVGAALRAVYRPWLERTAQEFQAAVLERGLDTPPPETVAEGGCLLFVDGLRLDLGERLRGWLEADGLNVDLSWRFAAQPSVTSTAKYAVSPIAGRLLPGLELTPKHGKAQMNVNVLRRLLEADGYTPLLEGELGSGQGRAWTECGDLDSLGHSGGAKLPSQLERALEEVHERIQALLGAGWQEIRVVTDHGWLLLPGGFPRVDLPEPLTEIRKGRCARLKEGVETGFQTLPWRFDPSVRVALAPGIGVFVAGSEYEHGGLSVQECVTPVLSVRQTVPEVSVRVGKLEWRGLRLNVQLELPFPSGLKVDLRRKAADPNSSVVTSKAVPESGRVSLPVEDDTLEGSGLIVVVTLEERILAQLATLVGGE